MQKNSVQWSREEITLEEQGWRFWEAIGKAYCDGTVVPFVRPLSDTETSDGRHLYVCDTCAHTVWMPFFENDPVRDCENCKTKSVFTRQQQVK